MKLVVYFKDCPVRSPTLPILGLTGGPYHFSWDQERGAHCRRYDLDDPAEVTRLRIEQARLYNQQMPHPMFFDVEGQAVSTEAVGVLSLDLQRAIEACVQKDKEIAELKRRLARPKAKKKAKAKHIDQLRVIKTPVGKPLIEVLTA